MPELIPVTNLNIAGRITAYDPKIGRAAITYNADFSGSEAYELDFTVVNQTGVFGIPRSIFVDNSSNPSTLEVYVTGTDQYFVIAAVSSGYYTVNAAEASRLRFTSVGGATDVVTIGIYNYDVAPSVWFKDGPGGVPNPLPVIIPDGNDAALGDTTDTAYTGSGAGTVISVLKGLFSSFFGVGSGTADSGNPVKVGGRYNSALPTFTNGQRGDLQLTSRGSLNVTLYDAGNTPVVSQPANADAVSPVNSGLAVRSDGYWYNGATWDRQKKPNTTNRLLSAAATTNATSVKTSATDLFRIRGRNVAAAARYLKLYNKASAPVVGIDTPIMTLYLAAGADFDIDFDTPYYFATGLAFALTVNAADADTTALTAGDIVAMNINYQ